MHMRHFYLILTFVLAPLFSLRSFASPNGQFKTSSPTDKIKNDLAEPGIYASQNSSLLKETRLEISYLTGVVQKTKEVTSAAHIDFEKVWHPNIDLDIATTFGLTIGNILTAEAFKRMPLKMDDSFAGKNFYYDLGASLFIDPNDRLANFVDYQRYFATARLVAEKWGPVGASLAARYGYLGYQISIGLRFDF